MSLAKHLKKAGIKNKQVRNSPLWKGPEDSSDEGGVTQSLLSRFLVCRERFRLLVIEGLKPNDEFNVRLEYGNMWHVCEESFALSGNPIAKNPVAEAPWTTALKAYCRELCAKYQTQQPQIEHWYNVCKTQFPIYVDYWKKHADVVKREPLLQEETFKVPYVLPSGRVVWLRGKWDSVDLVKERKNRVIWLQENKSKGDIDEQMMQRQLTFDLQTMIYLIALDTLQKIARGEINSPESEVEDIRPVAEHFGNAVGVTNPIAGVRYNVIRRPLAGGRHSIRQHQPTKSNPDGESSAAFYERLGGLIKEDAPYFFMRWNVEMLAGDLERFNRECLNPILEQLCDWYEWVTNSAASDPFCGHPNSTHFRFPFGVYNPMLEGRASEVDEHLATGSELGLMRTDDLFPELRSVI